MLQLTIGQYEFVYNAFSFTLATMSAATLFLWLSRSQVSAAYKTALTVSGLVTAIAAYHYLRIFESWQSAYQIRGGAVFATGTPFNDAYRYVDWLLTVPLLLVELVLVMQLSASDTARKSLRLGLAAALMIILGYPGEIATTLSVRAVFGILATFPFIYIVWELFKGLSGAIEQQPVSVRGLIKSARFMTVAAWCFYPIVYMIPFTKFSGGAVETSLQIGYTVADLVAKAGVGFLIYLIAIRKTNASNAESLAPAVIPASA